MEDRRFFESLEDRSCPAFTATYLNGVLTLTSDNNDAENLQINYLNATDQIQFIDNNGNQILDGGGAMSGAGFAEGATATADEDAINTIIVITATGQGNVVTIGDFTDDNHDTTMNIDVVGQDGDDAFDASANLDPTLDVNLFGGDGDNTLIGGAGDDLITTGSGSNTIVGGAGDDSILAGSGDNLIIWNFGDGDDTISGDSNDTLQINASDGDDTVQLINLEGPVDASIADDEESFTLRLNSIGRVEINTLDGDDSVDIGDMSSTGIETIDVDLGAGNDSLDASSQDDSDVSLSVDGGAGNDFIVGSPNDDTLLGGDGNDTVIGNGGENFIDGGAGNDSMLGSFIANTILGGDGDDLIVWNGGDDSIDGGAGNDTVRIETFSSDDTITISADGARLLVTIEDVEITSTLSIGTTERLEIATDLGNDSVTIGNLAGVANLNAIFVDLGDGNDSLDASAQANAAIGMAVLGGAGNDDIVGSQGADSIVGGDDDDTITGLAGNDTLAGGPGNNLLIESGGSFTLTNNSLSGFTGNNSISGFAEASLTGGAGNDTIDASTFTGNVRIDGGSGNNRLIGGGGNDIIFGGSGDDTITGGLGNDSLFGGAGNNLLVETGGSFLLDDSSLTTDDGFKILSNFQMASLVGSAGDDTIALGGFVSDGEVQSSQNGSSFTGDATIHGGAGNDLLHGGTGSTSILGGGGDDTLISSGGSDTLVGGPGADSFSALDEVQDFLFIDNEDPLPIPDFDYDEGLDIINLPPPPEIETIFFDDIVGVTELTDREEFFNIDFSGLDGGIVFVIGAGVDALPPGVTDYILIDTAFLNNIRGSDFDDLFVMLDGATLGPDGFGTIDGGGGVDTIDYTDYGQPAFAMVPDGSATGTGGITSVEIALGVGELDEVEDFDDIFVSSESAPAAASVHVSQMRGQVPGVQHDSETEPDPDGILGDLWRVN